MFVIKDSKMSEDRGLSMLQRTLNKVASKVKVCLWKILRLAEKDFKADEKRFLLCLCSIFFGGNKYALFYETL